MELRAKEQVEDQMDQISNHALWWLWLGVALLAMEILTTSFGFLFFGISALIVALLCWQFGLRDFIWEMICFALVGAVSVPLFRGRLRAIVNRSKNISIDAGKELVLNVPLAGHSEGIVEYQGVPWTVFNNSETSLAVGDRVQIVSVEGIRLIVMPVSPQKGEG